MGLELRFEAAKWTTKYINDLPDSAFALIEPGGEKDEEGKTVPRTLRHLPHHKPDGSIDLPHLRNAMARCTHIKPVNMPKEEAIRKAHAHLLKHYRELGMEHPPCSVPGCEGYTPKEKKSFLEDLNGFRALQAELFRLRDMVIPSGVF